MNAESFYNRLAHNYHLVYRDWDDTIRWQSEVVARLLGQPPLKVLDCACGIGTQTIGLARLGYSVVGVDLSRKAVARARRELRKRGISSATVKAADMRSLPASFSDSFQAVICCDNPLAHMLTAEDLKASLRSMYGTLQKGGKLVLTTRDYDSILETRPSHTPIRRSINNHRTTIVFQLWNWQPDGRAYVNEHFIMQRGSMFWKVSHSVTPMRAHTRDEISHAADNAGFSSIEWKDRDTTGFFQPVMIAIRPN